MRRSDLAAADQSFQAALADVGVAESLRLPSLALSGSGGVLSADLNRLLENNSASYSIGPRLVGPLFDAGRGKARVEAAKARAEEAQAAFDQAAKQHSAKWPMRCRRILKQGKSLPRKAA